MLLSPIDSCSAVDISGPNLVAAVQAVTSGSIKDGPPVLFKDNPSRKSFSLKPGSTGVALGVKGDKTCVAIAGKRPIEVWYGWVPTDRWLETANDTSPKKLIGVWQDDGGKITIKEIGGGKYAVQGNAIWVGNTTHFGDTAFDAQPVNGVLAPPKVNNAFDCDIAMRRVGEFLIVSDNQACGAPNVTFRGAYRFRRLP